MNFLLAEISTCLPCGRAHACSYENLVQEVFARRMHEGVQDRHLLGA